TIVFFNCYASRHPPPCLRPPSSLNSAASPTAASRRSPSARDLPRKRSTEPTQSPYKPHGGEGAGDGSLSSSSYPSPAAEAQQQQQHLACSACKHQRRRCAPGCLLAPYFPAENPGSFRNSHRLFGIKNILKFLTRAPPEKRDDCMRSMLYEADQRASNPALGAYGAVLSLQQEYIRVRNELAVLEKQLEQYRNAAEAALDVVVPPDGFLPTLPQQQQQHHAASALDVVVPPAGFLPLPIQQQPWMMPQAPTLPLTIPEELPQPPIYGGFLVDVPPAAGAQKIDNDDDDEDANVGVKSDEDGVFSSMQQHDKAAGE
ncbi:hypothetical protein BRADI_2g41585v3, partial [Brachypodium distachyon]